MKTLYKFLLAIPTLTIFLMVQPVHATELQLSDISTGLFYIQASPCGGYYSAVWPNHNFTTTNPRIICTGFGSKKIAPSGGDYNGQNLLEYNAKTDTYYISADNQIKFLANGGNAYGFTDQSGTYNTCANMNCVQVDTDAHYYAFLGLTPPTPPTPPEKTATDYANMSADILPHTMNQTLNFTIINLIKIVIIIISLGLCVFMVLNMIKKIKFIIAGNDLKDYKKK